MIEISSISQLPNAPAVYAMFGGAGRTRYVAYVGVADRLKQRVNQHLVLRDSSIATGTSAVGLRPDFVTQVEWWEHDAFANRVHLEAAELVSFDVFEPALRSRGGIRADSKNLYEDPDFHASVETLFRGQPTGRLTISGVREALSKIDALERRVADLESALHRLTPQAESTADPRAD